MAYLVAVNFDEPGYQLDAATVVSSREDADALKEQTLAQIRRIPEALRLAQVYVVSLDTRDAFLAFVEEESTSRCAECYED